MSGFVSRQRLDDLSQSGERQIDALALRERVAAVCTDAWKTWEPEMKRSIQQIVDGVGTLYGTAFLSSFASGGQRGEGRGKKKVGRVDTLCFFADRVGNREKFPPHGTTECPTLIETGT